MSSKTRPMMPHGFAGIDIASTVKFGLLLQTFELICFTLILVLLGVKHWGFVVVFVSLLAVKGVGLVLGCIGSVLRRRRPLLIYSITLLAEAAGRAGVAVTLVILFFVMPYSEKSKPNDVKVLRMILISVVALSGTFLSLGLFHYYWAARFLSGIQSEQAYRKHIDASKNEITDI